MELIPFDKVMDWFVNHYGIVNTLLLAAVWYLVRQLQTEQKESGELKIRLVELTDKGNDVNIAGVRALARLESKIDQLVGAIK